MLPLLLLISPITTVTLAAMNLAMKQYAPSNDFSAAAYGIY